MTVGISIRDKDLAIVRDILRDRLPKGAVIRVFGSRARGAARRGSNLDLAIDAGRPLTETERGSLTEAFEESDLPYGVDVLDVRAIRRSFLAAIQRGGSVFLDWDVNPAPPRDLRL